MRYLFLLLLFGASAVNARQPPKAVLDGCLLSRSVTHNILIKEVRNKEWYIEENETGGRRAFYQIYNGKRLGYEIDENNGDSIIFDKRHIKIRTAVAVGAPGIERLSSPMLAFWAIVRYAGVKYLCVSDAFEGLGRSGSFQNLRQAYVIGMDTGKEVRPRSQLFYTVGDIRKIGRRQGKQGTKQNVNATP